MERQRELPKELLDKFTEIICVDIGSRVLDGITYVLISNTPAKKAKIERYSGVRRMVDSLGYSADEIFRMYKVSNGYIFDIDMGIVKMITSALVKLLSTNDPSMLEMRDLIGTQPDEKTEMDMKYLAKKCLDTWRAKKNTLEVALYNRNKTNKIILSAEGLQGEKAVITYPAYVTRPNDLETINVKYLIERGIRISGAEFQEILGNDSGLRCILYLDERVKK